MAVLVQGTGVVIRLATGDEVQAAASARHGRGFVLTPPRSWSFTEPPEWPLGDDDALIVAQAFIDFTDDDAPQHWRGTEHHGHVVPMRQDATLELLRLADDTADDLVDLLGEMRIAGLRVSRWEVMSAPRRIELEPLLAKRLAPLQHG